MYINVDKNKPWIIASFFGKNGEFTKITLEAHQRTKCIMKIRYGGGENRKGERSMELEMDTKELVKAAKFIELLQE